MRIVLCFMAVALFLASCEKILFDDRNKYLGDYHFTYSYYTWVLDEPPSPNTYAESNGEVYYDKKDSKDLIIIEVSENLKFECEINDEGEFRIRCGQGEFTSKKNVSFDYSSGSCNGGGMGGGVVYHFEGKKK